MNELYSDEEWRVIPGFNGAYEVSSYGRVLSHHYNGGRFMSPQRYKILKPFRTNKSSRTNLVGLSKNGVVKKFKIAKLVAGAFLSNPKNAEDVGFFDGDPDNLHYKNLFWIKTIKDIGERKEFKTGAARDIQNGKGRCDLLPLNIVERLLFTGAYVEKETITFIESFKSTGKIDYLYITLIKMGEEYFKNAPNMLLEVSEYFEKEANKYGENNWQECRPASCYINSAVQHYLKMLSGDTDEMHDQDLVWDLLHCIWICENKPELNDYAKQK